MTEQPRFGIRRRDRPTRHTLAGEPPLHERHKLARSFLLSHLSRRPEVQACLLQCATEGTVVGTVVAETIQVLEAQAHAAGLPSREALLTHWLERYQAHLPPHEPWAADDPELDQLCDYMAPLWAFRQRLFAATREPVDTARSLVTLVELTVGVTQRLGLTDPKPLAGELMELLWYEGLEAYAYGRASCDLDYVVEPIDPAQTVDLHIEQLPVHASPAEVSRRTQAAYAAQLAQWWGPARGRMPKDPGYVERNISWLLRHSLDNISVHQLAREYLATQPTQGGGDGRRQVQEGIASARDWLNAVELVTATEIRKRKAHRRAQGTPRRRAQRESRRRNRR